MLLSDSKELKSVEAGIVKMRRDGAAASLLARQSVGGTVTHLGKPASTGWVALWYQLEKEPNVINAGIQRGRVVPDRSGHYPAVTLARDGSYLLDVPKPGQWFVVVERPGHAPEVRGPIKIAAREKAKVDVACSEGGAITGRIRAVPKGFEGQLWVVAFLKTVLRFETPVAPDGTFRLEKLPAGEFGLKVGYDGFMDTEVPRLGQGKPLPKEAWITPADPWRTARTVTVVAGKTIGDVALELPKSLVAK